MWVIYFIIMTVMGSLGAVCLKLSTGTLKNLFSLLVNKWFYFGCILYLLSALLNIYALKKFDYSVVLPMTAMTYIWTVIFSKIIFKENINWKKIAAISCIIIGVLFIAYS